MPAEVVESWYMSRRFAQLNGQRLKPQAHALLNDTPVSVQRGQAEAFFLSAESGGSWILKKFHQGRSPDDHYLRSVGSLLPKHEGFVSGTARSVLSKRDLRSVPGSYYSVQFGQWLEGALLMPRIEGVDWATVADEIRAGGLHLDTDHRLALCRSLTSLIELLEQSRCAHRDLSSGNVFIDMQSLEVRLIDFDSLYHPSLPMPDATTCGTEGYTAPFTWRNGLLDASATWRHDADRFTLALLNVEFLLLQPSSPLTAEGGMFDQRELCNRAGDGISQVRRKLQIEHPLATPLFEAALQAESPLRCPSPEDWARAVGGISAPPLDDLETVSKEHFLDVLLKRTPATPLWPAPKLSQIPVSVPQLTWTPATAVSLPDNPWTP